MKLKEFKKLKVGDKIKITSDIKELYKIGICTSVAKSIAGKIYAVKGVSSEWVCTKETPLRFTYKTFNKVTPETPTITEHIIKDNKTIVKLSNGKVGVAKCNTSDTFDIYEGLLIATARAYGKEVEEKPAGVREVKRKAKTGEYIKIVNKISFCIGGKYKEGDVLKVERGEMGVGVIVNIHGATTPILDVEYVVLENYKPSKEAKA